MAAVSLHQRLFAHCSTKKAAEQRGQSSPAFYRYFFHISPFYCTYIVMRSIQPFYHTAMGVVWIVPVVVNPHKQNLSGAAFQCLDVTPDLTVAKPKSSLCFISSCRESVKFFSRDHLPVSGADIGEPLLQEINQLPAWFPFLLNSMTVRYSILFRTGTSPAITFCLTRQAAVISESFKII